MNNFRFNLEHLVIIDGSLERGKVIGRAEYLSAEPMYLVRYLAADGRMVEGWWTESALVLDD